MSPRLTLESLPRDGAWVLQHQKNPVEVKCCHLKWEGAVGDLKNEWHRIRRSMCIEEGGTLTLRADDNTLTKLVAKYC